MKVSTILTIVLFLVVLLGSIGAISYYYIQSIDFMKEQVFEHLENVAQSKVLHIKDFLESDMDRARIITAVDCVQESIENIVNEVDVEASFALIEKCVKDVSEGNNNFYEIIVVDKNGDVIVSHSQAWGEHGHEGTNMKDKEGFIEGMKGFKVIDAHDDHGIATLGYVGPIKSVDEKEINGVLIIHQALDGEINKFDSASPRGLGINNIVLDKTGIKDTGEVYLINKDGYAITPLLFKEDTFLKFKVDSINSRNCLEGLKHFKLREEGEQEHAHEGEHIGHEAVEVFLGYRGEKVIGTHVYIPEMDWCLLAEIDESQVLGAQRKVFQKVALTLIIIIVIFATLSGFFVGRFIDKRIVLKKGKKRL